MNGISFTSLIGVVVLLAAAVAFSKKRSAINWKAVGWAFAIQAGLGAFILYSAWGQGMLLAISQGVNSVISYGQEGITFLFGDIGRKNLGFIFAFHVLPVIVFFSSLVAVLYYVGIMGWLIRIIGGGLQRLLGTSRPESMSAAANIFVGQTEAPLVVRPFIPTMTQSELFAVMVGGLASVAGSVLVGYSLIGVELKYLVAASFMAAPGGLLMAKILVPETDQPKNDLEDLEEAPDKDVNVIHAAANGASSGMQLAMNVGAMLLAFVALIALLNGLLAWVTGLFGADPVTLQQILGWVFQPLAFIIGVPWHEAELAGSFIGQKLILNEFVAYSEFVQIKDTMSTQTQAIVTFALCGFANISSIAILLGGIGSMAPSRKGHIAQLGVRAVYAATLANLMSAALAGFFLSL